MGYVLRVRFAAFFTGAATASALGLYVLYNDYKLAHESISQQVLYHPSFISQYFFSFWVVFSYWVSINFSYNLQIARNLINFIFLIFYICRGIACSKCLHNCVCFMFLQLQLLKNVGCHSVLEKSAVKFMQRDLYITMHGPF